jgi:hypothetical protein
VLISSEGQLGVEYMFDDPSLSVSLSSLRPPGTFSGRIDCDIALRIDLGEATREQAWVSVLLGWLIEVNPEQGDWLFGVMQ